MYLTEKYDYKKVLYFFEEISRIPRGSGNTGLIADYIEKFAKEHNVKCMRDDSNNCLITLPATPGFEGKDTVMIQGHLDMVCEKDADCAHDFTKDPLELYIENDELHARGTTLGGDDGIAIAYMLALIADKESRHPALELLMTTDEETGMYGAKAFDKSLLHASYLINIDSEEEGICYAGCAGGLRQDIELPVNRIEATGKHYVLKVGGLTGGHSGVEIHKPRLNANKVMARVLFMLRDKVDFLLLDISGGKLDNAITRDCKAEFISEVPLDAVKQAVSGIFDVISNESRSYEPGLSITLEASEDEVTLPVLDVPSFEKLLYIIVQAPYGVQKMSADIEGLVESSLNLGVLKSYEDHVTVRFSLRSSVTSYKTFMSEKLAYLAEMFGAESVTEGEYPAWEYRKDSVLREKYKELYLQEYKKTPEILVMHAGLECGLLSEALPELDIISIGPDMRDVHSPREKLGLESAVRVFKFVEKLICML